MGGGQQTSQVRPHPFARDIVAPHFHVPENTVLATVIRAENGGHSTSSISTSAAIEELEAIGACSGSCTELGAAVAGGGSRFSFVDRVSASKELYNLVVRLF